MDIQFPKRPQIVAPIGAGEVESAPTRPTPSRRAPPLFLLLVVAPIVLAAIYELFLASPLYVSEARFVVRAPARTGATPLSAVFQGVGLAQADTDAFAAHEYVMSRNAIADLERSHNLRAVLSRPEADLLSRFPRPFEKNSGESLYKAFPRYVSVEFNSTTGISTLKVKAFRAKDARDIAAALLDGGEGMINQLNDRAARDAVSEGQQEVLEAEQKVGQAQRSLTQFRNRERLIDPGRSSNAGLELVGKLSEALATLRAERAGLAAAAPQSPQLPGLDDRIRAYERQIELERSKVAGEAGSLAPKMGEYERLVLEREFADKDLAAATGALEQARLEARRKRLYLERVVNPVTPDAPSLPHRWMTLATIAVSLLLAYGAAALILAGLREHRQE